MRIYVIPSSGGRFPNQLAILCQIYNIVPTPELILATSGGNLCSYIALAGDFTPEGIQRVCTMISSKLFSSPWWPKYLNFIPSWIIGTFKGSIYKQGKGSAELMSKIFTNYNISRIEICTGTTERSTGKHQIFSNKSESQSIFKNSKIDNNLLNCNDLKYTDGDIKIISKVCTASASIPVYVPDKKIMDKYYIDGGTTYWSPLTPLADCIDNLYKTEALHIDYINGSDIESNFKTENYFNIVQNTDNTLGRVIKSLAIQDRLSGIELIRKSNYRNRYKIMYSSGKCNASILKDIENSRKYGFRSFLELYTTEDLEIDITHFTYLDIACNMEKVYNNYSYRFWILVDSVNIDNVLRYLNLEICNSDAGRI